MYHKAPPSGKQPSPNLKIPNLLIPKNKSDPTSAMVEVKSLINPTNSAICINKFWKMKNPQKKRVTSPV